MSGTVLLTIALVWFLAVLVWSRKGWSFFIGGKGNIAKAASKILLYSIFLLTWGWLVPLAFGLYRLIKRH